MKLISSSFSLRKKDRVHATLEIREERVAKFLLLYVGTPLYVSFAGVDWIASGYQPIWGFVLFRIAIMALAGCCYYFLRGRASHSLRFSAITIIATWGVEAIMIRYNLAFTPYFSGMTLLLFTAAAYAPKTLKWSTFIFTIATLPSYWVFAKSFSALPSLSIVGLMMLSGAVGTFILHSAKIRQYLVEGINAKLELARDLRSREQEVREKALELVKRKRFESQFSPQVVSRILDSKEFYEKLDHQKICTLVVDVKNSTTKASSLSPEAYAEVIEEVFDIIAASCLKWNITIDKFTGDGAQAFAGSPEPLPDDLKRTIQACVEIKKMLNARHDYLKMRWQGDVELRFGICEGEALVGFLGKGSMRSFTAIGNVVSLTHRICAEAQAGKILVYSYEEESLFDKFSGQDFEKSSKTLTQLKGFEGKQIKAIELSPRATSEIVVDSGRCPTCSTPLVMTENAMGIPKAVCPSCSLRTSLEPQFKKNFKV